jgi:hypothetical protein
VPCQRIAPVIDELAAEACDRGEDVAHAVSPSLPPYAANRCSAIRRYLALISIP